jgi:hypothetical protein
MKTVRAFCVSGLLIGVCLGAAVLSAQEPARKAAPRGRLPAHYKDLVSPDQKEEIYAIQGKYNGAIADLEAKIEALKKQRDAEVERVLTPKQQERLKLLVASKGKGDPADKPKADAPPLKEDNGGKKEVFPK